MGLDNILLPFPTQICASEKLRAHLNTENRTQWDIGDEEKFHVRSPGVSIFLISVYPYLEKTPNFNIFYKKLGPFYKKSQPGVFNLQ